VRGRGFPASQDQIVRFSDSVLSAVVSDITEFGRGTAAECQIPRSTCCARTAPAVSAIGDSPFGRLSHWPHSGISQATADSTESEARQLPGGPPRRGNGGVLLLAPDDLFADGQPLEGAGVAPHCSILRCKVDNGSRSQGLVSAQFLCNAHCARIGAKG
jgi:hypothetical protein